MAIRGQIFSAICAFLDQQVAPEGTAERAAAMLGAWFKDGLLMTVEQLASAS